MKTIHRYCWKLFEETDQHTINSCTQGLSKKQPWFARNSQNKHHHAFHYSKWCRYRSVIFAPLGLGRCPRNPPRGFAPCTPNLADGQGWQLKTATLGQACFLGYESRDRFAHDLHPFDARIRTSCCASLRLWSCPWLGECFKRSYKLVEGCLKSSEYVCTFLNFSSLRTP